MVWLQSRGQSIQTQTMRSYFKKLLSLLDRPAKLRFAALFFLMCLVAILEMCGLSLILPLMEALKDPQSIAHYPILEKFYPETASETPNQFLIVAVIAVIVAYVIKNVFLLALFYLQSRFVQNRIALMSYKLLEGYLHLPYTFHLQRNTGSILRNVENSILSVFSNGVLPLLYLCMDGLIVLGLFIVLIVTDPVNTALVAAVLGFGLGLSFFGLRGKVRKWGKKVHVLSAEVFKWINQSIGGIKETKILGREKYFSEIFAATVFERARYGVFSNTTKQAPRLMFEVFIIFSMAIVICTTLFRGEAIEEAIPSLGLFAVASFRLLPSMNRIASSFVSIRSNISVLDDLHADFNKIAASGVLPEPDKETGKPFVFSNSVQFEQVRYTYPKASKPALVDIDLVVRRGETVGIVGPTGAGKTTLVEVLLGLLTPQTGRLLLDGKDVFSHLRSWQSLIGYVPQTIYLIDDTLRRNIAFGIPDEKIKPDKITDSLRFARLEGFVASLEHELDTMVGERGVRLSGGQRQRIGIARALYHNPEVLIMDEATSSLDNQTEREISMAIQNIASAKTLIIIAHRLSTVLQCDRVVYMKGGTIVDIGRFDDLVARNPEFRHQAELGSFSEKD